MKGAVKISDTGPVWNWEAMRCYEKTWFLYGGPYRFSVATHPPPPSLQHVAFWKVCPPSSPELMRNRHPGREALSQNRSPKPFIFATSPAMQKEQLQSCTVTTCDVLSYRILTVFPTPSPQIMFSPLTTQQYHPNFPFISDAWRKCALIASSPVP